MHRSLAQPARRCCCRRAHAAAVATAAAAPPPIAPPTDNEREARLAANQLRTAGTLLTQLAPAVRGDTQLPARLRELAQQRLFNSSSRRLYREILWTAVRHWAWVETLLTGQPGEAAAAAAAAWLAGDTPETARLRAGDAGALAALGARPTSLAAALATLQAAHPPAAPLLCAPEELAAPTWFPQQCTQAELPPPDLALSRAPLYIRLQRRGVDAEASLRAELAALGVRAHLTALDGAWELRCSDAAADVDLAATSAFLAGAFEVQDLGSQALLAAVAPAAGGTWLDACAGAGGKSLQLAALLGPQGRVHASDVRPDALRELRRRAKRAGLEREIITLPPEDLSLPTATSTPKKGGGTATLYDGVLVDAPCTGSGTWRRAPHLRWQLSPGSGEEMAARQLRIAFAAARRVRPGGLLVYATCSLADVENSGVVDALLGALGGAGGASLALEPAELPGAAALGLTARDGRLTLSPAQLNSDGFFVAALRRTR